MGNSPMTSQRLDDKQAMQRALALAERGRGAVEPNPMVGAVLLRDGKVIGEALHKVYGGTHAEVLALEDCRRQGGDPTGATLVVTLEPCFHHGMNPPCIDAVMEARIGKVLGAMVDPFDKVAGKGFAALRQAGVTVEVGLCESQARQLNEAFVKRVQTGLPWVMVKWAQTLDGRIATASGDSKWISHAASRRRVHEWRARVDAVMVGIATALHDDPQLTARDVAIHRHARRIVVDRDLQLPLDAILLNDDGPAVVIATAEDGAVTNDARQDKIQVLESRGVEVVSLPWCEPGRLDLAKLFAHLTQHYEATNVLVEGGASLIGSLLRQELVDQVRVFVGPNILGDVNAVTAVRGLSVKRMAQARPLVLRGIERIETDVLLDYSARAS
jgi:diaminohydroxyphosphoribosylaminopyrimidine deaminase/5-amino-6-(5-phosphoribosylamino)uracil reductase